MKKNCCLLFMSLVVILIMSSESYAYREVLRGSFLENHKESIIVLDSKEDLSGTLSDLRITKPETVDNFDFSREFLVLIIASACPNPGYRIVAENIDFKDGKVNVKYKTESGPEGMMYAQVISYPWLLAAVER
ncbi:MAG: protease complex subunit PrcB family protein [Synergistaceae bacterium]|nr:protease complex subunit PrcB family protein [Synergistaceae bacterium]